MQTSQHRNTRCPVYLHPSLCTSRGAVEDLQRRTGLLAISSPHRRTAAATQLITAAASEPAAGSHGDDAA
ncbi:hypothetical protein DXT77_05865 [Pseudomonas sp. 91RF]|nr:hypothetical protein DXT77_05865 [Pseudomonas sp. 91RF]